VLAGGGGLKGPVIDADRLLAAADRYVLEMRRIGQGQSARDMEKNVRKARDLLEAAPPAARRDLRGLLEHEKSTGIHAPHGHIRDPSGAVGFLWIRRSLAYQHRFFDLILNHHHSHQRPIEPPEAAIRAYRYELQPYHGWALQRLYLAAMAAMTPATIEELLAVVGGYSARSDGNQEDSSRRALQKRRIHSRRREQKKKMKQQQAQRMKDEAEIKAREERCRKDLQRLLDAWHPLLAQWRRVYADLDLEDPRRH
jgi:hypothetical protein